RSPHGCLWRGLEQSQNDDSRVVNIWIDVILEFKCPAAARFWATTHLPIAACGNLLSQEPLHRTLYARMVALYTSTAQSQEYPGGIPNRRHAGLKSPTTLVFQHEACQPLDCLRMTGESVSI